MLRTSIENPWSHKENKGQDINVKDRIGVLETLLEELQSNNEEKPAHDPNLKTPDGEEPSEGSVRTKIGEQNDPMETDPTSASAVYGITLKSEDGKTEAVPAPSLLTKVEATKTAGDSMEVDPLNIIVEADPQPTDSDPQDT